MKKKYVLPKQIRGKADKREIRLSAFLTIKGLIFSGFRTIKTGEAIHLPHTLGFVFKKADREDFSIQVDGPICERLDSISSRSGLALVRI